MENPNKDDTKAGKCALCDNENANLRKSHSIPKFVYQWIKETSATPYLRSSDNVNKREQDGPKEYLLCEICEEYLSAMETEFSEKVFKKIANYRSQSPEILVTESMRACVLSIFWRALLTTLNRESTRTDKDNAAMHKFLESAKRQIKTKTVTTTIFIAPFYGNPPFYGLPESTTYLLDRATDAQDIRFFDNPHRYFVVFKLPFMFFYIYSEGWLDPKNKNNEFTGKLNLRNISEIPEHLREYIKHICLHFERSAKTMSNENLIKIKQDLSNAKQITGSHKSIARSQQPKQSEDS